MDRDGIRRYLSPRRQSILTLVGVTIVASLLRLYTLGKRSLWIDEGSSVAIAGSRLPHLVHLLWLGESNMALYYVTLHFWLGWGRSEFAMRSLSVTFAVATIPLIYALGCELLNPRVALAASLMLAVNADHIEFAQDARGYAMVVFLCAAATYYLVRGLRDGGLRNWSLYVIAMTLAGYTHLLAMLELAAHVVGLVWLRPGRHAIKSFAGAFILAALLWIPLVLFAVFRNSGQLAWVPPPSVYAIGHVFYLVSGDLFRRNGTAVVFAGLLALALGGVIAQWGSTRARALGFLWTLVLTPLTVLLFISHWQPMLVDRYLLFCMPAALLLGAAGLSELRNRSVVTVYFALLMVLLLRSDLDYYRYFRGGDWRDTAQYVLAEGRPGDAVILFPDETRWSFDYYYQSQMHRTQSPRVVFPNWDSFYRINGVYAGGCDAIGPSSTTLVSLPANYRRVWLVLSHDGLRKPRRAPESRFLQLSLAREYGPPVERDFVGIRVLLYAHPQLPPPKNRPIVVMASGHRPTATLPASGGHRAL